MPEQRMIFYEYWENFISSKLTHFLVYLPRRMKWILRKNISHIPYADPSEFIFDRQRRSLYKTYVTDMFLLTGMNESDAVSAADKVISFNSELYALRVNGVEIDTGEAPASWAPYFETIGLDESAIAKVSVYNKVYFNHLDREFDYLIELHLHIYLKFQVLFYLRRYLPMSLYELSQNLEEKLPPPTFRILRWEAILGDLAYTIPQMMSALYCQLHDNENVRHDVQIMAQELKQSFRIMLRQRNWMSQRTRRQAMDKLTQLKFMIGCPDTFDHLENVTFTSSLFFENVMEMKHVRHKVLIDRLYRSSDTSEWRSSPFTANAHYYPRRNEVYLPMAILKPEIYYNPDADVAVNYGSIGFIIGHEMTHAFDNTGIQFDGRGNKKDWSSKRDKHNLELLAKNMITQYNAVAAYYPYSDVPVPELQEINAFGGQTFAENYADIGGLNIAYRALQQYYEKHGAGPILDDLTPDQRFYVAYAQVHAENVEEKMQEYLLRTASHAPGKVRATAPASNVEEFYKAFGIEGGQMFLRRNKRIQLWGEMSFFEFLRNIMFP